MKKALTFLKNYWWSLLLVAFIIASFVHENGDVFRSSVGILSYSDEVQECYDNARFETNSVVVGQEYTCAIDVAATFYEEDPELAIELCAAYGVLPADDPLQTSLCKRQIEERLGY